MGMSVLHAAATCRGPKGTETVRWALEKGIPWNAANRDSFLPERVAVMYGNEESAKILREWAINHGSCFSSFFFCVAFSQPESVLSAAMSSVV